MIPVTLVTGFLGSGKTTLIAHLLAQPGQDGTLVVVNEFGEVGIDHDLLEASSDDTILLANGCLCCTIRGNLVDTLLDVLAQREDGRLRAFDRVVVETSGVADPAPLLGFLLSQPAVMQHYGLAGVVTCVDAVSGPATLARHPEAASQVAVADLLLLTKTDLAPPAQVAEVSAMLHDLNPQAALREVRQGVLDPAALLTPMAPLHVPGGGCGHAHHHDHAHDHTVRFRTCLFAATRAIEEAEIPALLAALRGVAGPALLRLKGFVPLAGQEAQLLLQGAMMVVHDARRVIAPGAAGRLVAISEGAPPSALADALAPFGLRAVT